MSKPVQLSAGAAAYVPVEGSLCDRILKLCARMPDEEWTSADLAKKFEVTGSSVTALLATARSHGLLRFEASDEAPAVKCWSVGPAFAAWQLEREARDAAGPRKPSSVTAALNSLARASSHVATASKPSAPRMSLDDVVIRVDVPIPASRSAIASRYRAIWDRMAIGNSIELPDSQAAGFSTAIHKAGGKFTIRRLTPTTKGIWRTA
jgi:hypothetical protein